jgi:hypothetical protein
MVKKRSDENTRYAVLHTLTLIVVVLTGALLRLSNANWDGGYNLHPDERAVLFVAQSITVPTPSFGILSPHDSPLNPLRNPDGTIRSYSYGHLPLYATAAVQRLLALPCKIQPRLCQGIPPDTFAGRLLNVTHAPAFGHLTYVGRALSALYDTLTILVTALLAGRLFGREAGLPAAAMMAFAVLHIQNAHFGTVDTALTLFSTLSVLLLADYALSRRRYVSILAGCCVGLAVGCKASGLILVAPLVVAHLERVRGRKVPLRLADHTTFWLSVLGAVVAFGLTNPYAVLDPVPYLTEIVTQAGMTAGTLDWPFTRQFIGTMPFVYVIEQQARWTLGFPLTCACYGGLIWAAWKAWHNRDRPLATALATAITLLLVTGSQFAKFPRYTLPLTPLLVTFAAGMLTGSHVRQTPYRHLLKAFAWLAVLLPTLLYGLAFLRMYDQDHPWIAASTWIHDTLPYQSTIVVERWDDPLPLDLIADGTWHIRDSIYNTALIDPFAEPDDQEKLDSLLSEVASADYVILSSDRLYGTIPRLSDRYPLTGRYYRALFGGELGFELAATFSREPNIFGISLNDNPFVRPGLPNPLMGGASPGLVLGPADESFTVYDHPRVLVFQNAAHLPAADMRAVVLASPAAP